jgi:TolB-like protein
LALQKDRNLRYQTAAAIRADLLAYKRSVGTGQASSPPRGVPITDEPAARAEEALWVAVLPFKITASDKELESLADGLTEDVTAGLSRFPYLRVVAYNSAMTYKSRSTDIRAIGRELGARYVVDGSIRKRGRALRINAQLVDAASGVQLWAETYNRELGESGPFKTLDDVTDRIVATVAGGHGVLVRSMATATREKPWNRRAHRNWYRVGSHTSCNSKLTSTPGSVRPSSAYSTANPTMQTPGRAFRTYTAGNMCTV